MENYLIDRQILASFVDELMKEKTLPVNTVEELQALREKSIKALDDKISMAIFSQFTNAENAKFNELLDNPNTTEAEYSKFFADSGIDIKEASLSAMHDFAENFLKGDQNA